MANTITGETLLQRLSEVMGDYITGTVDSGGGNSVVDTELQDRAESNDAFRGWLRIKDTTDEGAPEGEIRRIKASGGFTQSTGTVTVSRNFSANPDANDTYEIHRVDPVVKFQALNRALREVSGRLGLYRTVISEEVVTGNFLLNNGMQDFNITTALPSSWEEIPGGTITLTYDDTGSFIGKRIIKTTSSISSSPPGGIYQDVSFYRIPVANMVGRVVTFKAWILANAVDSVRLQISDDGGSSYTYGSYADDRQEWQLLSVEHTVTSSSSTFLRVAIAGTDHFQVSLAYAYVNGAPFLRRYLIPSAVETSTRIGNNLHYLPSYAYISTSEDGPKGQFVPLSGRVSLTNGKLIRLIGKANLTPLAIGAEWSTSTELNDYQAELVIQLAAYHLSSTMFSRTKAASWDKKRQDAGFEAGRLEEDPAVRMPKMGAHMPDGWHVEESTQLDTGLETSKRMFLVFDG